MGIHRIDVFPLNFLSSSNPPTQLRKLRIFQVPWNILTFNLIWWGSELFRIQSQIREKEIRIYKKTTLAHEGLKLVYRTFFVIVGSSKRVTT